MDGRELRNRFGKFPTGVTIVSWFDGKVQKGITVNSFTSVSLDPPLALVSIHKEAKASTSLKDKAFTINILSDEQESIAWQFAGSKQKILEIDWNNKEVSPKIHEVLPGWNANHGESMMLVIMYYSSVKYRSCISKIWKRLLFIKGKWGLLNSRVKQLNSRVNRPNSRVTIKLTSKPAKLTSKTAKFTSKPVKFTSKTAEFTSKPVKLTSNHQIHE
ncbi:MULTISPECIES: flavin reductase family protein [Peribacillus]|uniref:flavin reductase family protein n=1 Tax=Peribacillus TaxID=2675229 RepID=UPI00296FC4A3|nr:flavin reductase family protein [Peribacillus simplex]MEA3574750.1 flavin reductase family protein [Peribacillus frigoritolerans]